MRKLQQTKSNLESEKFTQLKEFEMEKLEMLKKIEELLMLNDILVGSKRIFDDKGNTIDTIEVMSILSPVEDYNQRKKNSSLIVDFTPKVTIRGIIEKLTEKYLETKEISIQTEERKSN